MSLSESPFHAGEQQVQARLGVRDAIEPWARQVIRPYLPEEHRVFHTSLPFLVAAARDAEDRPWVTLLTGERGFVRSPDPQHLAMEASPLPGDALEDALVQGADLGLLGIELATRRRNRVNGRVTRSDAHGLLFEVGQSFGNCPQYIRPREFRRVSERFDRAPPRRGTRLTSSLREWISGADTFFIGSGYQGQGETRTHGMDASHRGGDPGFVKVVDDTTLVFPDYAGNNHFNTIGNLVLDPRAGLLFVDFEHGSVLQLTGTANIDWDSEALERFHGARRLVTFHIDELVELEGVLPLRWDAPSNAVRSLRVVDKRRESDEVFSFVFEARDGGPLADFEAGQHLPIALQIPDQPQPVLRTYSLSNGPGDGRYRISVKRELRGLVSNHLHDHIDVGAIVNAAAPAGEFVLAKSARPAVLVSAGIGVTPMVSMLGQLTDGPQDKPVWFVHGARDGSHHPLADESRALVNRHVRAEAHVAYSHPQPGDVLGVDYDSPGRVDADLIARLLPGLDAEFYLCGPKPFMADVQRGLLQRGVAGERIHLETFGPAG